MLPNIATIADDIAIVRSMHTDAFNHAPAQIFMNTGSQQFGRPSLGAWTTYGLGSENNELPAFVVLTPNWSSKADAQALFTRMWSSGYLPTRYTGVALRSIGDPVLYIDNPPGVSREDRGAAGVGFEEEEASGGEQAGERFRGKEQGVPVFVAA